MAPYTNMPDDVKKMAMETEAAITRRRAASVQVPDRRSGRQDGRMQGRRPSRPDGQILGMNWYVKGIDDKIPGQ